MTSRRVAHVGASLVALGTLIAAPLGARGDATSGVDATTYRAAFDNKGVFSLEGGDTMESRDLSVKLTTTYGASPLSLPVPGIGGRDDVTADSILKFALGVHFTIGFGITEALTFGLDAGVYRTDTDDGYGTRGRYSSAGVEASTGLISLRPLSNLDPSGNFQNEQLSGPYDVRLGFKYKLKETKKLKMSLLASATVPFGDEEVFMGDSGFVLEPRLAVDYRLSERTATRLVLNAAARIRDRQVVESYDPDPLAMSSIDEPYAVLDIGSEAVIGAGLVWEASPQVSLATEAVALQPLPRNLHLGTCRLDDGQKCDTLKAADYFADRNYGDPAAYALAGFNYRITADSTISMMGGLGLYGDRSEDFRIMAGVIWAPVPAGASTLGRGDRDADGVPDVTDVCPDEPEDRDGYQDDDGCPELDNDGDGIIDASDACVDEPEDRDGFEDEDGCPERDNDGDGVQDVTDRCPNDKEDIDGFEDDDGCPDEDNDGDGIEDAKDKCPNDPETVNGVDDNDGCPDTRTDTGPYLTATDVNLRGNKIEFTGRNQTLTAGSKRILEAVGGILRDNGNVRVRVEVHVNLGTKSKNKNVIARQKTRDRQLSQRRAQAILDYLTKQANVPVNQIQAVGIGADRPLGNNPPEDPNNERVDFVRTQQN